MRLVRMILGLLSSGDDDIFRDEYCLANEVDSKWAAKPLALNRTKCERSSNSKTLAVSALDRILELGPGRPLNLSPSCCLLSSGLGRFSGNSPVRSPFLRRRKKCGTVLLRRLTTCGSILPTAFGFSLLCENDTSMTRDTAFDQIRRTNS